MISILTVYDTATNSKQDIKWYDCYKLLLEIWATVAVIITQLMTLTCILKAHTMLNIQVIVITTIITYLVIRNGI